MSSYTMRSLTHLVLVGSVVAQVFDAPNKLRPQDLTHRSIPSLTKRAQSEPCAQVSDLWVAQNAENKKPSADTSWIIVPAQRAYDCLMSVPVDLAGDVKEIQELKSYLEYQSTLAWLKSGVKDLQGPLDIMGGLDAIAKSVQDKKYKSDYEVQFAIRRLLDGELHIKNLLTPGHA
jgi:hypothetical protein